MNKEADTLEVTKNCYVEYGKFVNGNRSFPGIDGLKIVQRRILSTFKNCTSNGEYISCPTIVGKCIQHYHPHSDESIYSSMVTMINEVNPIIEGKGNFGFDFRGFLENVGAAASRYTKSKLNKLGEQLITLFDYSDFYTNENDYQEPKYIPIPIPYCLISGTEGLGVGCATKIPSFKLKDLVNLAKDILNNELNNKMIIPYFGGGKVEITNEQLHKLHEQGECSLVINCGYKIEETKTDTSYIINDIPKHYVNLGKLKKLFKDEILNKEVIIKNETQEKVKLVVVKSKKCKLTKDKFEKILQKGLLETVSFKILISDDGIVKKVSPRQYISKSLEYSIRCYERFLNKKKEKLEEEIMFLQIRPLVLSLIEQKKSADEIIDKILENYVQFYKITREQINRFLSKSVLSIISNKKNEEKLLSDFEDVLLEIGNLKKSYEKNILNKLLNK